MQHDRSGASEMSGGMQMNNPTMSRKRPLADTTLELNTPKRECYHQFPPYPYMNMMTPPPMFHSTPFSIRSDWKDENHQPPPFMPGDFCQPVGPIFNEVTLAELKRRIAPPECLNSSFLGIYLRLAKTKEVGKELRDNLAKHGISLPSGRRKGIQNTVFTCLVEEEATQLGRDMHTLVQQHYPVRPLIDMAARKSVSHPEERQRDLIGAIRILDELNGMFTELQTPLATRIQNNVPIHNELELGMNHFNLITHTFGPINQSTWCNAFLNYAKMSLALYQGGGMEQSNPQNDFADNLKYGDHCTYVAVYGIFKFSEAEASLHPSTLEIVLWCSPDFEGSVWFCEAYITIGLSAARGYAEQGRNEPIREERNSIAEGGVSHVERKTPPDFDRRQSQEAPSDPTTENLTKTATPSNVEGSTFHTDSKSSLADDNNDVGLEVLFALEERIAKLEKTSNAAVVYSNLEAALLGDLRARIKQLELDSNLTNEISNVESATLRNLEARIAQIEASYWLLVENLEKCYKELQELY
ncbi:unnamed protein product [Haemonchus placei]|uniref:TF_AP-2 domain-containing protein n=1 Tax=Haemonchus placei TaxID=6290 RepID=A0A158QN71_HAEPC|nr:unnamed protein product [Haemonchus placei]